jgi:acetyltransferase-like isoleucine patch superfamily enzyme
MFSSGVILRTDDGHGIFDLETEQQINPPQDIVVGDHVWLGNGSRVNKGATIGSGTVVGQMSVVSGNLESQCIYAGVPAKKLKQGVGWARHQNFDDVPERFRQSWLSF